MALREVFARRLRCGETLFATFVKARDPAMVEALGRAGFDFLILDAEHVGMTRADLAILLMAARAARVAAIVRVPQDWGHWIGTALDAGAAGVMVPQVTDAAEARDLVRAIRFAPQGRLGFSPSTTGAEYGARGIAVHLARQPQETVLICQVEDPEAAGRAAEIASVDGVDALLVGPVDMAVAAGEIDPDGVAVGKLCTDVLSGVLDAGGVGGLFLRSPGAANTWRQVGASLFVLGSDLGFLLSGAGRALDEARAPA